LVSRLQRHGLVADPIEAVMVYDLSEGPLCCASNSCVVRRIERPDQIEHYRHVAEETLGKDYSFTCGQLADGLARGSTQHLGYVAYEANQPAAIGRLYTHPLSAFAGLYGGTTAQNYRRRGFYRALVASRSADAITLGARYLLVDALPTSRPILQRLGFQHLTDTIPCNG
jgi:hypothetical protein